MQTLIRGVTTGILVSASLLISTTLLAEDNSNNEDTRSGGYLKIGSGYKYEVTPYRDEKSGVAIFISGRYQFNNGLYIEASHGANELSLGNSVGYNFFNTEHWSFDAHISQAHGSTSMRFNLKDAKDESSDIKVYHMDRSDTQMLGLRTTGTYGQTTIQFIAAPYSFNKDYDDGVFASAWLAHSWQIKNWELYASAGVNYRSKEIVNYYYATSDEIVSLDTPIIPAYKADGGFDIITQVGLSYPVSESILFESYLRYTDISDSISDSPVMQLFSGLNDRSDNVTEFGLLFSYVF
jgi:outer membrane scaffolding protein for murein synthesis (MipA/OmpV family)